MAQLVSVYYGSDGVTTFDGTNYQFFKMPEFLKLTTTYADVLAYADTIANAVSVSFFFNSIRKIETAKVARKLCITASISCPKMLEAA